MQLCTSLKACYSTEEALSLAVVLVKVLSEQLVNAKSNSLQRQLTQQSRHWLCCFAVSFVERFYDIAMY